MKNVLIVNGHQRWGSSPGELNRSLVAAMAEQLGQRGYSIRQTVVEEGYDVAEELAHHQWADVVIMQLPVYWMSMPWLLKKYMDEVYTAGLGGELCNRDGRSNERPAENYGTGGTKQGSRYMLSLTFNAPPQAFANDGEWLFEGRSVDDLFMPMHCCFRFFGMTALETFVCYDVKKNPQIEQDFERLAAHIERNFPAQSQP